MSSVSEVVVHPLRAFGEQLERMLRTILYYLNNFVDELVRHILVEKVGH